MRGTKSKRLRRLVYGEASKRGVRHATYETGQVVCVGLRGKYLKLKRNAEGV